MADGGDSSPTELGISPTDLGIKQNDESVPREKTAKEILEQLPCIETADLLAFASVSSNPPVLSQVPVELIVSAPFINSWYIKERGADYISDLSTAIAAGKVDLDSMDPPQLFEIGGLYAINADGRHRVAALKLLQPASNLLTIKAEVNQVKPFSTVHAFTAEDFDKLDSRRTLGLWSGSLSGGTSVQSPTGYYASGKVESYEGPWVFSRDMEKAKGIYQALAPSRPK